MNMTELKIRQIERRLELVQNWSRNALNSKISLRYTNVEVAVYKYSDSNIPIHCIRQMVSPSSPLSLQSS
jgi:hypothetical protein